MIVSIPCPSAPHPIGGVTALYEFANGLARRGHEVHLVHAEYFGSRITSLDELAWFRFEDTVAHHLVSAEALRSALPDVPRADVVFATGLPRALGLPVLLVQGFEMLYPELERAAFRTPSLKVCIARWLVDVGAFYGVERGQFRVVVMGIDHGRFHPPADRERDIDVAVLHNRHPAKGWSVAAAAFDLVRRRRGAVSVAAFGTTAPDHLAPGMTFQLDPGGDALARDVYGASRVFLQASDYEGFGFTAVEAMACGAALVTTDNGGSRDYAIPGETALVVAPGDVEGLALAIETLLDDDDRRRSIAGAGERLVRRFDWDLGAQQLEQHLLDYVANPSQFLEEPGPARVPLDVSQGELANAVLRSTRAGTDGGQQLG